MPREETVKAATSQLPDYDTDLIHADTKAIDARHNDLLVIDAQWGESLPYDRFRLENEAKFYLSQSAEAMLEAGKRLLLLKEHEMHGEFTSSLERIGIHPRTAQRMMLASVKFSKPKTTALSFLGKSKMLELMTEEDDSLDALADGGTIAGMTMDEIDKMSVRELKQALRDAKTKAKEDAEVAERILNDKDKKINELDNKLTWREVMGNEELHAELDKAVSDETSKVLAALVGLTQVIARIYKEDSVPEHIRGACYHSIERVRSRLRDMELDYDVQPIITDTDDIDTATGMPVWAMTP